MVVRVTGPLCWTAHFGEGSEDCGLLQRRAEPIEGPLSGRVLPRRTPFVNNGSSSRELYLPLLSLTFPSQLHPKHTVTRHKEGSHSPYHVTCRRRDIRGRNQGRPSHTGIGYAVVFLARIEPYRLPLPIVRIGESSGPHHLSFISCSAPL